MTRAGLVLATLCGVTCSSHADTLLRWADLSKGLKGTTIEVITKSGEFHRGKFLETKPDAIVLKEKGRVEIPRTEIAALGHEFRTRGTRLPGFEECLSYIAVAEVGALASIELPLMLVAIPVTAAVGIVGIPVLALWDLFDRQIHEDRVVILPDPPLGVSQ